LKIVRTAGVLMILTAWSAASAGPASRPAARPADEPILGGALFFRPPPDDYHLLGRSENDRSIHYATADGAGAINLAVVPQDNAIGNLSQPIAQAVVRKLKAEFEEGHTPVLMQPRVEKDPDLFIRIHEKFKNADGRSIDQIHIFRVIGIYLVSATVTAASDDPAAVNQIHKLGEDLLWTVHTAAARPASRPSPRNAPPAPAPEPVTFAESGIRLLPPRGWNADTADNPQGVIATYHDLAHARRLIVVSARPLNDVVRRDAPLREALLNELLEADSRYVAGRGATATGRVLPQRDARFAHKARMSFLAPDGDLLADSRQVIVGATAVSVLSVSPPDEAADTEKAGDAVAASLRAALPKPPTR